MQLIDHKSKNHIKLPNVILLNDHVDGNFGCEHSRFWSRFLYNTTAPRRQTTTRLGSHQSRNIVR